MFNQYKKKIFSALAIAGISFSLGSPGISGDVTGERLLNSGNKSEEANWLTVHRSYDSHRFSPLQQINAKNVNKLKLAFSVPLGGTEPTALGTGSMQTTPLVNNGMMYVSDQWGTPYKIDVSSGKRGNVVWIGDTGIEKDPDVGAIAANRGVALWKDLVITNLIDGRVMAFDDASGDVVWDKQITQNFGEGFTGAPLALPDKIIVGQSLGDWATRGFIAALDPATGNEIWRFYTVPAPGEPGSETWLCDQAGNPDCWKTGGASAWVTGSYDVESNTLLYGTGNPVPMYDPEYRPGDNLYSNSTLAIDADTGKLKWHFQYTPGDYLDYDEVGTHLLYEAKINGENRKVLGHYGRNGFFYTFDRTNGSFISANQYIDDLNWTKGIDPKTGKPLDYEPGQALQVYALGAANRSRRDQGAIDVCPHLQGGVNFWPVSYNRKNGMAYAHSIEGCYNVKPTPVDPADVKPGNIFLGGATTDEAQMDGSIIAVDVKTGMVSKKVIREYPAYAGVMSTPDLVWVGELDGTFGAYDARSLDQKWSLNVGTAFKAPAISYSVNGKQYVAIVGGPQGLGNFGHKELDNMQNANMLYVFTL